MLSSNIKKIVTLALFLPALAFCAAAPVVKSASVYTLLTSQSNQITPGGSPRFAAMTTNSITLTKGTWQLFGMCNFNFNGSSPGYSDISCDWYGANGADNNTPPAALSTVVTENSKNLTIETVASPSVLNLHPPIRIVTCASSCTVFLVMWSTLTTPANSRQGAYLNAMRVN